MADAAALLHRQRGLLDVLEDRAEIVLDQPHHEAVEQGYATAGAGAGDDAAGRKERVVRERALEPSGPARAVGSPLGACNRRRDPRPRIGKRRVHRRAVFTLEAVLHIPDFSRNRGLNLELFAHYKLGVGRTDTPFNVWATGFPVNEMFALCSIMRGHL